jgi:hypothetical protein
MPPSATCSIGHNTPQLHDLAQARTGTRHELSADVQGVCLSVLALKELHDRLHDWVSLPLNEMGETPLQGSFPLALAPSQTLTILFGERKDTASTTNPTVAITLHVGNLRSEYHYITDQSCVRLFADALQTALRKVAA